MSHLENPPYHFIVGAAFGDNVARFGDLIASTYAQASDEFDERLIKLVTECKNPNCTFCHMNNLRFATGSQPAEKK